MNYPTGLSDEKLIRHYLSGDTNAMATLVQLYKDRVYTSIYNLVQHKHVAEEIFQQVFICLINDMVAGKAAGEENFLQWATKVAQQLCVEHNRSNIAITNNNAPATIDFALPALSYHESHGKIKSMIDMLPGKQREVMLLNHYGGLSFNEIAETLKCTVGMALDYMKLALNNLCKMMAQKEMAINYQQ